MAVNNKRILSEDITLGMYISALDRPWIETDFSLEGFFIDNYHDIEKIQKLCKFVYIDVQLTKEQTRIKIPEYLLQAQTNTDIHLQAAANTSRSKEKNKKGKDIPISDLHYEKIIAFANDFRSANQLYKDITRAASQLLADIGSHKKVELSSVKRSATTVVDSVVRNPDALLWLTRLYEKDSHSHHRSLRTAIWAIAFARYLGLEKDKLNSLSTALLLCNIGKAMLPVELLLHEDNLTAKETQVYEQHVDLTLNALKIMGRTPQAIITIIRAHCERYDGSGYPMHLMRDEVSFLAQIAGLVTYYEAITNRRLTRNSLDAVRAVEHLYNVRNKLFSSELVDAFIQSMGIYPVGSIVELSTQEVAIVVEQNNDNQFLPRILILRDKHHKIIHDLKIQDLCEINQDSNTLDVKIINAYPLGMFGINVSEVTSGLEKTK